MKYVYSILILASVFAIGWLARSSQDSVIERIEYLPADTVIVRDTILLPPPPPQKIYAVRTDTVTLHTIDSDTVFIEVKVPIERKEYKTDDYLAVIEGFRPQLVAMTVYPKIVTITKPEIRYETVKSKPRFGVGLQAGYGVTKDGLSPYLGIGIQYNLITF
jgi:hypothetical protein